MLSVPSLQSKPFRASVALCFVLLASPFAVSCVERDQSVSRSSPNTAPPQVVSLAEDDVWSSEYYCPVSGVVFGANRERAHGGTIFQGLPATVNLVITRCEHVSARCVEINDAANVVTRKNLKMLVPASLESGPLQVDGGFLRWRSREDGGSKFVEFLWAAEPAETARYGYTIMNGKLESFWGFDFTANQTAGVGEACHLVEGDGLLGIVDFRK